MNNNNNNECSGGVYYIRNIINEKMYIGSSVDIKRRISQHKSQLNHNRHYNPYLQNAWNKYGEDNFEFGILEEFCGDFDELREIEADYIEYFQTCNRDTGYNMSLDTECFIPDDDYRKKMSEKYRGENNPFFGKHHTEESKQKIREAALMRTVTPQQLKGLEFGRGTRSYTEETYKKLSEANRGERSSSAKLKEIDVIDILNRIKAGEKQTRIAEEYGVNNATISKIKTRKTWGYLYETMPEIYV